MVVLMTLLGPGFVCAEKMATFQELENYFYVDGKMERSEGRFKSVYFWRGTRSPELESSIRKPMKPTLIKPPFT